MHDPQVLLFSVPCLRRRKGRWVKADLFTVWHVEPGGQNAGTSCRYERMKWHVWHWRISVSLWGRLRRRWLTRCAWCDGRSTDESPVNIGDWSRIESPWWMGEAGLYHVECMQARDAHESCTCIMPATQVTSMICVNCGLIVRMVDTKGMRRIRELKDTPVGVRPVCQRHDVHGIM